MISEDSIASIARIICGDTEGFYSYKTGSQLVVFFNEWLHSTDKYGPGFPSRWIYTYDKLVEIIDRGEIDRFLKHILGVQYIVRDLDCTEVEAFEKSKTILAEFNRILANDRCLITHNGSYYNLVRRDDDMVLIGSGGFADVFFQESSGLVLKKLKDDYMVDPGIRSRFKREYSITLSLQDMDGIIRVFSFDEGKCEYTMERAERTLQDYVLTSNLDDKSKLICIRQVLAIMKKVHNRDIIHRDLSPNNVFIISGSLKIADFGLGKDLNVFTSHQTIHTNAVGQYYYCAPEQFMMLKDGDKRSDVYSLGRIINFIMTGNPVNSHHKYGSVCSKATNSDAVYRYSDAVQLSYYFEKSVEYNQQKDRETIAQNKILNHQFDFEIEEYIYNMSSEQISKNIKQRIPGFLDAVVWFMSQSDENAQYIIQGVDSTFRDVCGKSFEAFDPFADLAEMVLSGKFDFSVKEVAAIVLRYVAWDVNRFSAQHKVENLVEMGVEPLIEEIIVQ